MKLVVVKSKFQVLLVPNWRAFRITVIYVIGGGSDYGSVYSLDFFLWYPMF